jgi:hypothetical protein
VRTSDFRKRLLLGVVWAYAAATWASIAHQLVALPDVVPLASGLAFLTPLVWSYVRSHRSIIDRQPVAGALDAAKK